MTIQIRLSFILWHGNSRHNYLSIRFDQETYWGYECIDNKCVRQVRNESTYDKLNTIQVCHLICEEFSTLWPRPTGAYQANKKFPVSINHQDISFNFPTIETHTEYWDVARTRFLKFINNALPESWEPQSGSFSLEINVAINSQSLGKIMVLLTLSNYHSKAFFISSAPENNGKLHPDS
jgi:hypothetical protein